MIVIKGFWGVLNQSYLNQQQIVKHFETYKLIVIMLLQHWMHRRCAVAAKDFEVNGVLNQTLDQPQIDTNRVNLDWFWFSTVII